MRRFGWLTIAWLWLELAAPSWAQEVETPLYGWNDSSVDGWTLPRGRGFSTTPSPVPEGAGCLEIDVPGVSWDQGVRRWEAAAPAAFFRARRLRLDVHLDAAFAGTWFQLVPVFTSAVDGWYPLEARSITIRGEWLTLEWSYDAARIDPAGFQLILVTQSNATGSLFVDQLRVVEPSPRVLVDEIGHRVEGKKHVLFTAPPGKSFTIRRASDDSIAFRVPQDGGSLVPWQGGAVDDISGDRIWHGDFTLLVESGSYYVDSNLGRSVVFDIREDVYDDLARQAVKSLYYDRCGVSSDPTAAGPWQHGACHVAASQDREARMYVGGQIVDSPRDVSGGWHHGGGDYGKYVTHLGETLWFLMRAYEKHPALYFDGSTGIPESGNGIPDLLDEVAVELHWLRKMQRADGSVHHKLSALRWLDSTSPPEAFTGARYVTETSTRATAIAAGLFARGAKLFYRFDSSFASKLQWDAERAWDYLEKHPLQMPAGGFRNTGEMTSPEGSGGAFDDRVARMFAATQLYRLSRHGKYRKYFDDNWDVFGGPTPVVKGHPDEHFLLTLAMIDYIDARRGNSPMLRDVKAALRASADDILLRSDAYRSPMDRDDYRFASNRLKVQWATVLLEAARLELSTYVDRYCAMAAGYLHYLHGRNPLGQVYLTNAEPWGAEHPVFEPYHFWFPDGNPLYDGASSTYGPPPMMMVNGPNDFYHGTLSPPLGQPPSRAYVDTNTTTGEWVERSWEFNEPAIGRTAAYVYLVTWFTCRDGKNHPGGGGDDVRAPESEKPGRRSKTRPRVKPHPDPRRNR